MHKRPGRGRIDAAAQTVIVGHGAVPPERFELLVHAGAQLPASTRIEIVTEGAGARLRELARAYGVADRLCIASEGAEFARACARPSHELTLLAKPEPGDAPRLDWDVETSAGVQSVSTLGELVNALGQDGHASSRQADPAPLRGQRIALLTNLPNHYRVPLLNGLARRIAEVDGTLRVFFSAAQTAADRPWLRHQAIEFDYRFLSPAPVRIGTATPLDLGRALRDFDPTLIVSGGFSPLVSGRALRFAEGRGVPFVIWSGDTKRQPTARSRLRLPQRRSIARRSTAAIAYGWLSAEYLRELAPNLPLVIGRNTAPVLDDPAVGSGEGAVEFLTVGQAIPRKGLDVVVDAFRLLGDNLARLTIVGGGNSLDDLMSRARGLRNVRFLGPIESDRVLQSYRKADAFLFPSRSDVFGLVLVEALGSGLPTISATAPGGVPDLCVAGHNCLLVDGHDAPRWAEQIDRLARDEALRRLLGSNGRRTILCRWTIEHAIDAFIAGLRLGLARSSQIG